MRYKTHKPQHTQAVQSMIIHSTHRRVKLYHIKVCPLTSNTYLSLSQRMPMLMNPHTMYKVSFLLFLPHSERKRYQWWYVYPLYIHTSLVPRLFLLRAHELMRVMTFEPPLIFTGVQRTPLAISTRAQRGEPGDEATYTYQWWYVYLLYIHTYMCSYHASILLCNIIDTHLMMEQTEV